jgi:Leucine-rich repeat (LRR) protein
MRHKNSNFHLLSEAYRQVLTESKLPPVGPGVCYFETEKRLTRSDAEVDTTTKKWEFIKDNNKKPIGIMSTEDGKTPSGSIVQLRLFRGQLTSFDGSGLKYLKYLNISDNQLTSFSGDGLTSLIQLDLSSNHIVSFSAPSLSSLKSLYFSNNRLTHFDGEGLSSLRNLTIFQNRLTSFDGSGLSNLEFLDIGYNELKTIDCRKTKKLQQIFYAENPFHNTDGPAVTLSSKTKEYWIDGKKYEDEHAYKVARAKYLRPQEAAKVMKDAAKATGIADLEGLWDDF